VLQCVIECCRGWQCVAVWCNSAATPTSRHLRPHDSVLQRVAACCSVLQRVAACCSVLQRVIVCCSVLRCVAVCCSVLQRVEVCCSVLQCVAMCCSLSHRVTVCCSVLHRVAVCCSVFARVAVCFNHAEFVLDGTTNCYFSTGMCTIVRVGVWVNMCIIECVCVCMCVHARATYMGVNLCARVYVCCARLCALSCFCVCAYVCVRMCPCVGVCVCMYMHACLCVCVCIHVRDKNRCAFEARPMHALRQQTPVCV